MVPLPNETILASLQCTDKKHSGPLVIQVPMEPVTNCQSICGQPEQAYSVSYSYQFFFED